MAGSRQYVGWSSALRLAATLMSAGALAACGDTASEGGPTPKDAGAEAQVPDAGISEAGVFDGGLPLSSVHALPADLTTNHDGATVHIALRSPLSTQAAEIAPHASLRSLPSDAIVPTTATSGPLEGGVVEWSETVLTPTQPLAEGWYALVLAAEAKTAMQLGHQRPDGGWESRFRVGSDPLLLAVSACASKNDGLLPKLRIDTSEPVELAVSEPPITVVVDGVTAKCSVYDPPSPGNLGMGLSCIPAIPSASQVSVTVGVGIVAAASGKPLRTSAGPLPQTFELPPLRRYAACRSWHETDF